MRLSARSIFCTSLTLSALTTFTLARQSPFQLNKPAKMASDPQNTAPTIASSSSPLLLSDTMASQRSLSIFASLARDDSQTQNQFSSNSGYTIVLAPVNSAVKAMKHRPWENPDEAQALGGHAYKGEDGMSRAQRNLRRFVQDCLVVGDEKGEWKAGEKRKRGVEERRDVWWEIKDGKQLIMPEGIEVQGIVSKVANGEVWALQGTLTE